MADPVPAIAPGRPYAALLLLLVAVVLSVLAVTVLPLSVWAEQLRDLLIDAGPWGGLLFVAVFACWNLLLPPLPLQILAGFAYGALLGGGLVYVGSTIAIVVSFSVARSRLRAPLASFLIRKPVWRALDAALAAEGWRAVLLLRLSNLLPSNLANLACGCADLRLTTVLWASWVGKFPGVLMSVLLGAAGDRLLLGERPDAMTMASLGIGILASVLLALLLSRRARRLLQAERTASQGA